MDETINKEPVLSEAGGVDANQPPSAAPGTEPSAVDVDSLKAIIEPLVQDAFDRGAQSTKDKRIAKQESRIGGIEDTLAELKVLQGEGMSEKQAIQYVKMQELLDAQSPENPQPASPAPELAAQTQVTVEEYLSPLLQASGLDANDADVIDIVRKERDASKQMIAIANLANSRKQVTPANPAAVAPTGDGQSLGGETLESITTELNALYTQPATAATRARIRELGKKQKELLPKR